MATTKTRSTTSRAKRSTTSRARNAKTSATQSLAQRTRQTLSDTRQTISEKPYTSAAIATGAVAAVAAAAAGAYFFSRRDKSVAETFDEMGDGLTALGDRVKDGYNDLRERAGEQLEQARDKASGFFAKDPTQQEIAEEAMTLKETGNGLAKDSLAEIKAGAAAY